MYLKIGRFCFRHRKLTLVAWILLAGGLIGSVVAVGSDFSGDPEPPEDRRAGIDLITEHFGESGAGQGGVIVFVAEQGYDDPAVRAAMDELFAIADAEENVDVISPYDEAGAIQVARQGPLADKLAFARVSLGEDVGFSSASDLGDRLVDARPEIDGLQVEIGGQALAGFEPPESELIGLAFAIVVLIVSFGSVLAMGLPVVVALAGVSTGLAAAALLSNTMAMPDFATQMSAMIGLGVGIDYALFIVTRYRENLHLGDEPIRATGYAMDTAGRAVVFAGITVIASLLGLGFMGLEFVAGLGVAAAVTVLMTMLASTTLLPAMLGFAKMRIEVTRWRGLLAATFVAVALLGVGLGIEELVLGIPAAIAVLLLSVIIRPLRREIRRREPKPLDQTGWYRWSHLIQRRPWRFAVLGTVLLLVLAAPVANIRLGFSDEGNFPEESTTRKAYDLLADGFGPGFNGPFFAVAEVDGIEGAQAFQEVVAAIEATPGVAQVTPGIPNDFLEPTAMLTRIFPTTSPQDEATEQLVSRLRNEVLPSATADADLDVVLTGFTVVSIDMSDYMGERSLVFFGVVLVVSFILLMAVFRSLLVPLKAVIMNMLSIAAAYGVVVAIFQWGWLSDFTDIQPAPIEPFVPMMMFAIVFGLSMDYEVFLLSRIREEYARTDDAVGSVANGLAATARVISAAAAIMVVVFGSFLLEDGRVIKVFGTGLAFAVLLDATLVRMLLVPATMELLGRRNWWIPRWLDWLLPDLNVEGHPREELLAADDLVAEDELVPSVAAAVAETVPTQPPPPPPAPPRTEPAHAASTAREFTPPSEPSPEPAAPKAPAEAWRAAEFMDDEPVNAGADDVAVESEDAPAPQANGSAEGWAISDDDWDAGATKPVTPDDLRAAAGAVADAFTGERSGGAVATAVADEAIGFDDLDDGTEDEQSDSTEVTASRPTKPLAEVAGAPWRVRMRSQQDR